MNKIEASQYMNQYGGLSLVKMENGDMCLEMEDCFGPDYWGPLTEKQVVAFHTLCEVNEYEN